MSKDDLKAEAIAQAEAALNNAGLPTIEELIGLVDVLAHYAERFADLNGEPADGDCRRLIAEVKSSLPGVQPAASPTPASDLNGLLLVAGNPIDGLTFTGPFATADEASAFGERSNSADWWLAEVHAPF